jgi:uncharacterized protein (TIGR03067 family)
MYTVVLLAGGLLTAADAKDDVKKETEKLQGTWVTQKMEFNGEDVGEKFKLSFVFKGDDVTVEGNDEVKKEYAKLKFKLDPSTTPRCVDITITAGTQKDAVIEGIYELKGDELRICAKIGGKERPAKFESPAGETMVLMTLKREK